MASGAKVPHQKLKMPYWTAESKTESSAKKGWKGRKGSGKNDA